tara:strand:+ start:1511 stop:3331 length:1821 start_codon:yes stop_codon:yes gene_type:complete
MCGIAGFISKEKKPELIKNFIEDLHHRGPDNIGIKIIKINDNYLHLGSSRLAIRGNEKENMPMSSIEGNQLIYNGEIFDLAVINNYLNNGKKYESDTRMLLDLLTINEENVEKVNGMFAFAMYNQIKNSLFLGRDKLGIKPIFYTEEHAEEIYFSSEVSSLIKYSNIDHKLTSGGLDSLLIFNGVKNIENLISGVKTVKQGELISIELSNSLKINKKTFKNNLYHYNKEDKFENIMCKVIEDHLDADESVDLFLSGGLDSSLIAYFIKEKLEKDVRHFSMTFDDSSYDERKNIENIAETLNLESVIFRFDKSKVDEYVEDALNNMNNLVIDYSFVPTYLLSKETSNYTKAVISGDGADEIFGGYEWYRGLLYFNSLPSSIKKIMSRVIESVLIKNKETKYLSYAEKIRYFFKYIASNPYVQMIIWQSSYQNFDDRKIQLITKEINKYTSTNLSNADNYRNIDLNLYLYTNVLPKVDTASMASSLEVRPPYLDDRIRSYAEFNPNSNKVNFLNTKLFLREYISSTEIKFLNKSKKQGFGFPIEDWLKNYGLNKIRQMVFENDFICLEENKKYLEKLIFKESFSANDIREIWSYFVLNSWCSKNNIGL